MKRRPIPIRLVAWLSACVSVALAMACAGCGAQKTGTDRPGSALLRHIPADTPYLMAALEPTPRAELDHYLAQQRKSFKAVRIRWAERHGGREPAFIKVLLDELEPNLSTDGLDRLGLGAGATMAIYGIGILPALRVEIKDARAVEGLVGRIAAASGGPPGRSDGHGKRWEIRADEVTLVIAVTDRELLAGLAPTNDLPWFLDRLYGDGNPGPSLADSPRIDELMASYRLSPRFVGWLDFAAAMKAAMATDSLVHKELAELTHDGFAAAAQCMREVSEIIGHMPRIVLGATELSVARQRIMAMFELDPDLARDLAALRVSAVGVGAPLGANIASFGIAADVPMLIELLQVRARRQVQTPYRCSGLFGFNELASKLDEELAKPMPPWVKDLRGFAVELIDMEAGGIVPKFRGAAVVSAIDPIRLIDLAKRFMPQLPSINPPPDGKPVKVPGGIFFVDAYVAMKGQLFGVAVGDGADTELVRLMSERTLPARPLAAFAADPQRLRAATAQLGKGGAPDSDFPTADVRGTISMTVVPEERGLRFEFVHEEPPEGPHEEAR